MQIPDIIRIGSIEYEVEDKEMLVLGGQQCYGMIDFEASKIYLDTSLTSKQRVETTLLHEVVHGLLYHRSLKEEAQNEVLVDEIAVALHQLIKDNPVLFLPDELYSVLEEVEEEITEVVEEAVAEEGEDKK